MTVSCKDLAITLIILIGLVCMGDSCTHGKFDVVEFRRAHVIACTPFTHNWYGDIWIISNETGSLGQRFRWVDDAQPLCESWNRSTYWHIIFRAYQRAVQETGERYTAYDVMHMEPTQ